MGKLIPELQNSAFGDATVRQVMNMTTALEYSEDYSDPDADVWTYAARGVHGQTIWIDPTADVVIVRFASHPIAANSASDPTSLPAYRAVADHLMSHDNSDPRELKAKP